MNSSLDLIPSRGAVINSARTSEVLFVAESSPWGKLGYETVSAALRSVQPIYWSPGMPKPDLSSWHGDWIISFKSDLILSREILERAKKGAINFHPSPPKYRGVGGYWWALHNGDDTYGVTCHHMDERIDHGLIVETKNFAIWPGETTESLKHRAAIHSLMLLNETLNTIVNGKVLTPCGAKWERHLYTYKELMLAQNADATNDDVSTPKPVIKELDAKQAFVALEAVIRGDDDVASEKGIKNTTLGQQRVA